MRMIFVKKYLPESISACLILIFRFIYYKNVQIAKIYPDSSSYINFNWFGARTPVYPLFLSISHFIGGKESQLIVGVLFQMAISLAAVFFLYKAIKTATDNRWISCVIVTLWGGCAGVMCWDVLILTESLAISISIFFLYFAVLYLKFGRIKYGICLIGTAFLATWVKPGLVIYTAAVLFLLLLRFFLLKSDRNETEKLLGITGICIGIYLLYAYGVYLTAGVFNLSDQGPRHMLVSCLVTDLYKNYPDKQLVEMIEQIYIDHNYSIGYETTTPIMQLFGNSWRDINMRVNEFNSYCLKTDVSAYVSYLWKTAIGNLPVSYGGSYGTTVYENEVYHILMNLQTSVFPEIKIGQAYIIDIVSIFFLIKKWIKNKTCPWYYLGVAGLISSIYISVYIGTYNEWSRTTSYVLPFVYFGIALFLDEVVILSRENA